VTKPSDRPRLADNDRREIAKRIFDALWARYPQKYITLVQPRDQEVRAGMTSNCHRAEITKLDLSTTSARPRETALKLGCSHGNAAAPR
jgi:hypothetical protein